MLLLSDIELTAIEELLSNSYCTVMNLSQPAATSLSGLILILITLQQTFESSKSVILENYHVVRTHVHVRVYQDI